MGTKKCVEWGFGYGESEYAVSFAQAPGNAELLPSYPDTTEPFMSPFRAGTLNGAQIRTPETFVVPGHLEPEIKTWE